MINCDDWTVFHVSRKPIQPGEHLRKYYMRQYLEIVLKMGSMIRAGPDSLAHQLSSHEWQCLIADQNDPALESEDLKMMVVLEAIFEQARLDIAPTLPGRMDCVFTWRTYEMANRFRQEYLPQGIILRCRVRAGSGIELDGGLLPPGIPLADLSPDTLAIEVGKARARAEKYWTARTAPDFPEFLIQGNVEITGQVNAF